MAVRQGDIYWIDLDDPIGSEPGFRRPYVVVQNNVVNQSRIGTVVVCALTSNLKWEFAVGNVRLNAGEADLPRSSVANVSQLLTVNKTDLDDKIGTLTTQRVHQILDGIRLVLEPRDDSEKK